MWQARARQWQKAGIPVKFIYPEEGIGLYISDFSIPRNARNPDAAYAFLNAALEPKAKLEFARNMGYPSASGTAGLPADLAESIAIPEALADKVLTQDNDYLLKNDAALKDWWDKVFKTS